MNLENTRIDMAYQLFFQAVMNDSFKELLSAAYSLLRFPVYLSDDMSNTICQIPSQEIGDPDWNYILSTGHSSEEHFRRFYTEYLSHPETRSFPILIEDGDKGKMRQFLSALYQNGRMLGYTSFLIDSSDYTDEDIEIIRLFNRTCQHMMLLRETKDDVSGTQSVEYLRLLLETSDPESVSVDRIAKNMAAMYKPGYVICICSTDNDQTEAVYLCNEMMRANNQTVATMFRGYMVTLVSNVKDAVLNYSPTDDLKKFFQNHHFQVAISTGFRNLSANTIQAYYEQALQTLMCAGKQKNEKKEAAFYKFMDFAPQQLFLSFKNTNPHLYGSSRAFCNPVVYDMQAYDKKNGTEYFRTLRTYLNNLKNSKKTAEQLSIHVNTVAYRLDRLQELFDIDLNDERMCVLLLLSCMMVES